MEDKKEPATKPDEKTLHTTDPQENMEGPLSSLMQGIKRDAEEPGKEDAEKVKQADENKK
jgi:hypothetical protein